jgi:hypothetical protein
MADSGVTRRTALRGTALGALGAALPVAGAVKGTRGPGADRAAHADRRHRQPGTRVARAHPHRQRSARPAEPTRDNSKKRHARHDPGPLSTLWCSAAQDLRPRRAQTRITARSGRARHIAYASPQTTARSRVIFLTVVTTWASSYHFRPLSCPVRPFYPHVTDRRMIRPLITAGSRVAAGNGRVAREQERLSSLITARSCAAAGTRPFGKSFIFIPNGRG